MADVQQRQFPPETRRHNDKIHSCWLLKPTRRLRRFIKTDCGLGPDAYGVTAGRDVIKPWAMSTSQQATWPKILRRSNALLLLEDFPTPSITTLCPALSPEEYRHSKLLGNNRSPRIWLEADARLSGAHGGEDSAIADSMRSVTHSLLSDDSVVQHPAVIRGMQMENCRCASLVLCPRTDCA